MSALNPSNDKLSINGQGLDIIKDYEGLRLTPYQDSGGLWTVGFGHVTGVEGSPISRSTAYAYLDHDVENAEWSVKSLVKVPLNQNQFSALTSFVFNVGYAAFEKSTLLVLLNDGEFQDAAEQFPCWVHDGDGVVQYGLVRRRIEEASLFSEPDPTQGEVAAAYPGSTQGR